uniref:Uncharacterized protein n=1 Tax=viral metagenome TaxID=1070528 RepID=A0A6H1ZL58_9ZZZZ
MATTSTSSYARNLHLWTKSDDKKLLKAIADGHTVMDVAEELEREHVSVVRRLGEIDLFAFEAGSEEWVEVMTLGLGGAPLKVVIDWCNATPERLQYAEIEEMLMADFRAEFELAAFHGLYVSSQDVIADLMWLVSQPDQIRLGYSSAVRAIVDRYDIPTPATLKAQVLGLVPATAPWPLAMPATRTTKKTRSSTGRKRTYRKSRSSSSYGKSRRASSARSSSTRSRKSYA